MASVCSLGCLSCMLPGLPTCHGYLGCLSVMASICSLGCLSCMLPGLPTCHGCLGCLSVMASICSLGRSLFCLHVLSYLLPMISSCLFAVGL